MCVKRVNLKTVQSKESVTLAGYKPVTVTIIYNLYNLADSSITMINIVQNLVIKPVTSPHALLADSSITMINIVQNLVIKPVTSPHTLGIFVSQSISIIFT